MRTPYSPAGRSLCHTHDNAITTARFRSRCRRRGFTHATFDNLTASNIYFVYLTMISCAYAERTALRATLVRRVMPMNDRSPIRRTVMRVIVVWMQFTT